jgi:uncharacterized protein (UPF0335 family)
MPSNIERDLGQIFEKVERAEEDRALVREDMKEVKRFLTEITHSLTKVTASVEDLQKDMNNVKPFVDKLSSGYVFLLGFIFAFTSIGTVVGVLFSSSFQKAFKAITTFLGAT